MIPRAARALAAALCLLGAVSCATTSFLELSHEEQTSLTLAMATPLEFTVHRSLGLETWDRALTFVDRYSTMKLRSVTESTIQTYDAPAQPSPAEAPGPVRYGYTVARTAAGDSIQIQVSCVASAPGGEEAGKNAHIAAYYILTGNIGCARCIAR